MVGLPQGDSLGLLNTSYSVSAEITVPAAMRTKAISE